MTARTRTGGAAALVLTGLAGLHAYWARGGLWPGDDPASFCLLYTSDAADE